MLLRWFSALIDRPPPPPDAGATAAVAEHEPWHDELVNEITDALFHRALDAGGWVTEVGTLGRDLFRSDAERLVQQIALGGDPDAPPTP
jgi:hypothetical protein